jgi:hypothetical protein
MRLYETREIQKRMSSKVRIRSKSTNGGGCFLMFFFCLFLIAGCGVSYFAALKPWLDAYRSQSWTETPCVIMTSEVSVSTSKGKSSYYPKVKFSYTVDELEYFGERFWFGGGKSSDRVSLENTLKPFQAGGEGVCYVNPNNPYESVLLREAAPGLWIALLFGSIFSVVGLGGMTLGFGMFRAERRKRHAATILSPDKFESGGPQTSQRSALFGDDSHREEHAQTRKSLAPTAGATYTPPTCLPKSRTGPDEPLILEQTVSRGLKAGGLIFLALFWNGITGVVGFSILKNFQIIPMLFIGLFFVIGMIILAGAVHSFLQLFNPRTVAVCSHSYLQPGSEFEISWLQKGNAKKIKKLTITLEGKEQVSYRQGTNTRTETSVFFSERILETSDTADITSGFRDAKIPNQSMHTFEASSNKIIWTLQIHGEIPYWPDILDDFTIVVYPPTNEVAAS